MKLEDLKTKYISDYAKYIEYENIFDVNDFSNLMEELNGERVFRLNDNEYQFIKNFKETEDGPEIDYSLEESDIAEILIAIYEEIKDERIKQEYLQNMISNSATIPYAATTYFDNIKTKFEEINKETETEELTEEEEELVTEYGSDTTDIDTTTESIEEELEEELEEEKKEEPKEEIKDELKYDEDGPAIKTYKEKTEELKKELEDLINKKESTKDESINKEPLEVLEDEISELNNKLTEINDRKKELQTRQELVDNVLNRIYNHGRIDTIKDEYESKMGDMIALEELEEEAIKNVPQEQVDIEVLAHCENITPKLEEIKTAIENNEPDKKLPITTILAIKDEASKINDDKLRDTLLKNVQFMIENIIKPVNERDFNEVYNKINESLNEIKKYPELIERRNKAAISKVKYKDIKELRDEIENDLKATNENANQIYNDTYIIESELLRELGKLGYHTMDDEEISKLSPLQVEGEVDRLLNQIIATKGQDELNIIATRIKNKNSGISEEIDSINQEKNEIDNMINKLESNRKLIENFIERIDNVTPETAQEEIESIKEHIDFLNAPESVKESLVNRLNKKLDPEEVKIEDVDSRISELEDIIKDREEKTELYYSCLKDIQELDNELKTGLDIKSPEFKEKYNALGEKVTKLPKELAEEIMTYLKQMLEKYTKGKEITNIRKNPKLTWKTFAMLAGGLALGGGLGFGLAALGTVGAVTAGALTLGGIFAKHKINKKRKELREKRLNGTLEIKNIEMPTDEKKTIFKKFREYIKSEEGLRDLSWGLTGGIIGLGLGYGVGKTINAAPKDVVNSVEPTANVHDYEIGKTIGDGNFSSGYRSASDALSGTNSIGLNENSVNATNELKRIFVKGADGSWQNISTPGVKVSDLLAQGYDASDIAFSLANNGTDVAWMPYEQFIEKTAEVVARTR